MKYPYKSVKYHPLKWDVIKRLADILSAERGTNVSLSDASVEAAKRMIDERSAAGKPVGQAREKGVMPK